MGQTIKAIFIATSFALGAPTVAMSDTASKFLEGFQGKYSGKGTAELIEGKNDRVSCKLSNKFDEKLAKLEISGRCASVRGVGLVSGSIKVDSGQVKGGFLTRNLGIEIKDSAGDFSKGKLILTSSILDKKVGKLSKMKQIISKSGAGYVAEFFTFDDASGQFEKTGSLKLKQI